MAALREREIINRKGGKEREKRNRRKERRVRVDMKGKAGMGCWKKAR